MKRIGKRALMLLLALLLTCCVRLSEPGAVCAGPKWEAVLLLQGEAEPLEETLLHPLETVSAAPATQTPTEAAAAETLSAETTAPEPEPYYRENVPLPLALQKYIYELCEQKGLRYPLILSVIYHESGFDPEAVYYNTDGSVDRGLMQINSASHYAPELLWDPYENIRIGVDTIAGKIKAYGETFGLMAYKMGDAGMQTARDSGVINTKYARKILEKQAEYEAA